MTSCRSAPGPIAVLVACLAGAARTDDPARRGFDPDPSRLALSLGGNLAVETAGVARAGTRAGGLILDYTQGLIALRPGGERAQLLKSRLPAHLLGGYAFDRGEVAVHLPLALVQRSDLSSLRDRGVTGPMVDSIAGTALGDLGVFGKLAVLREAGAPLGLAALLDVRLPTGNRKAFTGHGLSAVPGLVATRTLGRVRLDAQLGYLFRDQGQYAQLIVHDGLTGGIGTSVLDAIATLIRDHPQLRRVRVEGHADNRGSAAYNKDLSLRRARSVVAALVQRGISADRLIYEGYGFDRPVADNRTALGRAKKRRVEFTILEEKP